MDIDLDATGRELLELAAKAAGIEIYIADNFGTLWPMRKDCSYWNPLTKDGDALRLSTTLRIDIEHESRHGICSTTATYRKSEGLSYCLVEFSANDQIVELVADLSQCELASNKTEEVADRSHLNRIDVHTFDGRKRPLGYGLFAPTAVIAPVAEVPILHRRRFRWQHSRFNRDLRQRAGSGVFVDGHLFSIIR